LTSPTIAEAVRISIDETRIVRVEVDSLAACVDELLAYCWADQLEVIP